MGSSPILGTNDRPQYDSVAVVVICSLGEDLKDSFGGPLWGETIGVEGVRYFGSEAKQNIHEGDQVPSSAH